MTKPATQNTSAATPKRRFRPIRWVVRVVVVLLLIGTLKFVGLDSKFYYPSDEIYLTPEELRLPYENVRFQTSDGVTLAGWFFAAQGEPKGTIIHFHGNAANITAHLALVDWIPQNGYNLLMFDYRGYGNSEGSVTRAGTIRDGYAALDYVLSRPDTKDLPIYAYGQSLGGAIAICVAADRPEIRAVVAESTFSGYRRVAALHARKLVYFDWLASLLVKLAISDGDDPIDVVDRLAPRPLFIIAAERDQICFPELARELYDAAGEPKQWWLVPRAEHLGILEEVSNELVDRVIGFFDKAVYK